MVDDIDEGSTSSDDFKNVYDGIQDLESTVSDSVESNHNPVHQYDRMTPLRSRRHNKENLARSESSQQ